MKTKHEEELFGEHPEGRRVENKKRKSGGLERKSKKEREKERKKTLSLFALRVLHFDLLQRALLPPRRRQHRTKEEQKCAVDSQGR